MKPPGTPWEEGLYYAALKISDSMERSAFLDKACAEDPILRDKLEEMLAAHAQAEEFFSRSAASLRVSADTLRMVNGHASLTGDERVQLPEDERPGTRIGRYRLGHRIGEGGCGTVYEAAQEEPVRRDVALKIIKLGMDTKSVMARFSAERQALALMEHPNIARALDAGATDKGRPYFVMELVRGVKMTTYCDQQNLSLRRRLELFTQVCRAIQHAHQKGIIHRDIKPSNILVTNLEGAAVPKVIDFGIAKAITGERLSNNTVFTATEQFMGTPAYMSPEQAHAGMDVDTRSDIYSLGVLLYELLTGKTPFELKGWTSGGMEEFQRTLREKEPSRPSALLASLPPEELTQLARQRGTDAARFRVMVKGDLDWIVTKALEKDRARRYGAASELAEDVLRFLNNEPVVARPPSRIYQFRKMVRRNRGPVTAVAAVLATLVLGLGTSTWWFFQERKERVEAEQEKITEEDLRQKADAQQGLTTAALAVLAGHFAEADAMVKQIPVTHFEPSYNAANVFRALGEWHVLNGRWKDAAYQFEGLLQVNQFKTNRTEIATSDLLEAAPPMLEAGDTNAYADFRAESLRRFAGQTNALELERILRASLLAPGTPTLMATLAPLAKSVENSLSNNTFAVENETNGLAADYSWCPAVLAMLDYRQSHYQLAADRCEKILATQDQNPARTAVVRLVLAMSDYRLGKYGAASDQLALARAAIEDKFRKRLTVGADNGGFWYDWGMARLLLREAASLIEEETPPAKVKAVLTQPIWNQLLVEMAIEESFPSGGKTLLWRNSSALSALETKPRCDSAQADDFTVG